MGLPKHGGYIDHDCCNDDAFDLLPLPPIDKHYPISSLVSFLYSLGLLRVLRRSAGVRFVVVLCGRSLACIGRTPVWLNAEWLGNVHSEGLSGGDTLRRCKTAGSAVRLLYTETSGPHENVHSSLPYTDKGTHARVALEPPSASAAEYLKDWAARGCTLPRCERLAGVHSYSYRASHNAKPKALL